MRRKFVVGVVGAVALAIATSGSVALAQHGGHGGHGSHGGYGDGAAARVQTGKVRGTVVRVGGGSVTISSEAKGGMTTLLLLMDGRTRVKGDLTPGSEVTVKYREEYGVVTATKIVVKKAK